MFLIDVNLDFIAVVETKINQTFPKSQFAYIQYKSSYRLDITSRKGMLFLADVKTDIPSI